MPAQRFCVKSHPNRSLKLARIEILCEKSPKREPEASQLSATQQSRRGIYLVLQF